ncbi:MAG: putative baseplate assembly protein [Cyanobacteria bacterium P01_F01_bin.150]
MPNSELFREFEFLPNLPKANLDDRTFNDLIQECKLRIPRYCQEWTNHNPSDPGITLIELFAWLTDQMLLRFNQVPRLNYVAFLELLGIRLQPPAAAAVDLTFYLTKPVVAGTGSLVPVPQGTEVATMRTESEPSVVFTTSDDLVVGKAVLKGLFTAQRKDQESSDWSQPLSNNPEWERLDSLRIFETSEVGNCFYLVLAAEQEDGNRINGNVIVLNFKGVIAGSTGIDPNDPPVCWQAWNGEEWIDDILMERGDDKTKGFSFHELQEQGGNPDQGADITLHLPIQWPEVDLGTDCRGHWIRCVYEPRVDNEQPNRIQYLYSRSPLINAIQVRTIGGAVEASECVTVKDELVGISTGKPGQKFQLEGFPILKRNAETEHIVVKVPDGTRAFMGASGDAALGTSAYGDGDVWQEVDDFGDSALDAIASHSSHSSSSPQSQNNQTDKKRHYTLDSQTGTIQFGPLVREPSQLQYQTLERTRHQPWGRDIQQFSTRMEMDNELIASDDSEQMQRREWQYGQVPPRGAEIYMSAYRVGGGSRGNVQKATLVKLKTAVPYVKSVINHGRAKGGKDAESLDEAVLRVPQVLRNAKTAMIPADFEAVAQDAHSRIYRAHCLPCISPGVVRLLAIASPPDWHSQDFAIAFPNGIDPKHYEISLESDMYKCLSAKFEEHKLLGVQVRLEAPTYVGVQVNADVLLYEQYRSPQLQPTIARRLKTHLYRYINPLSGGEDGKGWPLGRELSPSDVIAQIQSIPEVQYVGRVNLFTLRYHPYDGWFHSEHAESIVNPGPLGLLCSWKHDHVESDHIINFMQQ